MINNRIRLYVIVCLNSLDFLFVWLIVVVVMVIDWGEMSFVIILFVVFVVNSKLEFVLICVLVIICKCLNKVLLLIIELVMNMLI